MSAKKPRRDWGATYFDSSYYADDGTHDQVADYVEALTGRYGRIEAAHALKDACVYARGRGTQVLKALRFRYAHVDPHPELDPEAVEWDKRDDLVDVSELLADFLAPE
jgi:hypothetical protein